MRWGEEGRGGRRRGEVVRRGGKGEGGEGVGSENERREGGRREEMGEKSGVARRGGGGGRKGEG